MEQPSTDDFCRWAHSSPDGPRLVSPNPVLNNLLEVEKKLWSLPERRFAGDGERSIYRDGDSLARALLGHSILLGDIHQHFRNLEKTRCCLALSGRRKVLDNLRVVNTDPSDTRLLQGSMARDVNPRSSGTRGEIVLSGEEQSLYQNTLLSAVLPVLAAPAPPSPFTPAPHPASLPSPQTPSSRTSFGYSLYSSGSPLGSSTGGRWRSPSTDRDTDPLLNRLSAAASAFANLEKDVSGPCELSPLIVSGWAQAPFDVGPPSSAADVDSVTTDMLRELVRVVFLQTEAQQLCSEHELRESYGRRSYSEVLARHLMTRLSVLENNSHSFYKPSAFLSPQAYDQWVQREKQHIKQLIHSFWHYPLPHPSRGPSLRVHQVNHQAVYVELLHRLVKHQRRIKGGVGVPLSPTASRLLREYGLRFGVGELYRRIVYVELLSQNVEHEVWFNRHVASALLSVLDLLPAKPSQRTVAVKAELERLHSAMVVLHSHIDHALTRINYLFPCNAPPDGIPSLVQLLSLVLFAQRYLTNVQGYSLSHWLRKYLQDSFAWRYDYHRTVSAAELQLVSFVCPLTPSLINSIIIELRNEVLSLKRHFEAVFVKYFSISQLGQKFFYQMLMKDVQELCQYKQKNNQLDLERLALAFRLAELDKDWKDELSVAEQTWREPFFKQSLCWLEVLGKHLVRLVIRSCIVDSWSLLDLKEQVEGNTVSTELLTEHVVISDPLHFSQPTMPYASPGFSGGSSVRSAFSRVRTPVSTSALAGSFDSASEQINAPGNAAIVSPSAVSLDSSISSLPPHQPRSAAQPIDIPARPSRLMLSSSLPRTSFPNTQSSVNPFDGIQSSASPSMRSHSPFSRPPLIFRSENLMPIQPLVLHSPDIETPHQPLFHPLVESAPASESYSTSATVVVPTPLRPQPALRAGFHPVSATSDTRVMAHSQRGPSSSLALSGQRTALWVASVESDTTMNPSPGFPEDSKNQSHIEEEAAVNRSFARQPASRSDLEADMRRKVSGQSDHTCSDVTGRSSTVSYTGNWHDEEGSSISDGIPNAMPDSTAKVISISSSLVELVVLLARFTGFVATLTTVICPDTVLHRPMPGTSPVRQSPSRSSFSSVGSTVSLPITDGPRRLSWSADMDVHITATAMENRLHSLALDKISETAMLYADNLLFADLCGIPDDNLEKLLGSDKLRQLKQHHQDGILFGCRHVHMEQRLKNATRSSGSPSIQKKLTCSHSTEKQANDKFEPVTLEMCIRINNVASLAAVYPSLQRYLVDQLDGSKVHTDRDSGVPFSPLDMLDDTEKQLDARLERVCEHIKSAHDALVKTMAHRLAGFAGQSLCMLVGLNLPISLSEHLKPMTMYLSRHLSQIRVNLYPSSFQKLLQMLWSMLVQLVREKVGLVLPDGAGKTANCSISVAHATFLLRVIAYLMQFMHSDGAGLGMDMIVETAQPLLHALHLHTLSTSSLTAIHAQLLANLQDHQRCRVDLPVETLCRLRRDLHALRKCFTGRQLYDWLSVHGQRLGIHESRFHRIGQSLLRSGLISPVAINADESEFVDSTSSNSSISVGFEESTSSFYRFTSSDECRRKVGLSQLASCLELTHEADEQFPNGWQACQRHAADCVLQVLRVRARADKSAKVYIAQCAV